MNQFLFPLWVNSKVVNSNSLGKATSQKEVETVFKTTVLGLKIDLGSQRGLGREVG